MTRTTALAPALALALLAAGCATVEEPYRRPDVGLVESDTFADAPAVVEPTPADLHWWRRFGDAELAQWVERALAGNLDIAAAFARVDQAHALLRRARAARGPSVDASGRIGVERRNGGSGSNSSRNDSGAAASAGLNIEWDADLWGGLRQAEQSAAAELLRTEDLAQAARLAAAGTAARGYVEWREAQNTWQVLRETLRLREDTLRLARTRVDAGLAPAIDASRAEAEVAAARAAFNEAAGRTRQTELALHVLAGERPRARELAEIDPAPIPQLEGEPPVPRPIDLLRLRPDVRAAERALIAAYADVGVARATLYPQLRLPGELLLSAAGIGAGSIVSGVTASLAAALDATLYDGGARRAEVEAARAQAREAAFIYERTVLEALEQVESALIARRTIGAQQEAQRAAVAASSRALEQARAMYQAGLANFGDVLDAQRTWLASRIALMQADASQARAAIAMFEAIGVIGTKRG